MEKFLTYKEMKAMSTEELIKYKKLYLTSKGASEKQIKAYESITKILEGRKK